MPFPTPDSDAAFVARALAALPAAGAWDAAPNEFSRPGYDRMTLCVEYIQGAAGGSVDMQVQFSPYYAAAGVPAGQNEWFPMTAYSVGAVAGGADTATLVQANYLTFDPVTVNLESFLFDLDIPGGMNRFRVRAREDGNVANPGNCYVYVVLSRTGGTRYD